MSLEILEQQVLRWAKERSLLNPENVSKQYMKFSEEAGELAADLCRHKDPSDSIGDVLVTLIILANQCELDLETCLKVAYEEIDGRTGTYVDGVFIKDEVLNKDWQRELDNDL